MDTMDQAWKSWGLLSTLIDMENMGGRRPTMDDVIIFEANGEIVTGEKKLRRRSLITMMVYRGYIEFTNGTTVKSTTKGRMALIDRMSRHPTEIEQVEL